MKLEKRIALITGAGSGIGNEIASRFVEEGATVCIADVDMHRAEAAVDKLRKGGGNALPIVCDVSKSVDVQKMFSKVIDTFGRIDILVNNAGFWLVGRPDRVADLSEEDWDSILNVNLKGVFLCSKYALQQMVKQRSGVIISIASECGVVGCPNSAAYGASKAGIILLTKQMSLDYAPFGIRVTCIAPCNVMTPATKRDFHASGVNEEDMVKQITRVMPLGRFGQPREVANAALFLASDEASFTTGSVLLVDGGVTAGGTHTYL